MAPFPPRPNTAAPLDFRHYRMAPFICNSNPLKNVNHNPVLYKFIFVQFSIFESISERTIVAAEFATVQLLHTTNILQCSTNCRWLTGPEDLLSLAPALKEGTSSLETLEVSAWIRLFCWFHFYWMDVRLTLLVHFVAIWIYFNSRKTNKARFKKKLCAEEFRIELRSWVF